VGRFLPVKGLKYLIEAAKFTATRPTIVIIGEEAAGYPGTKRVLEEQVKKLGLDRDILFPGSFSREDLAAAYKAADLFVLPSLAEGLPLVLLEAMAWGKCVIATRVPGNLDVVRDGWNGILVEAQNSLELAQKIDFLLADKDGREKLGAQARRDVESNYSSNKILTEIVDLYQDVRRKKP
jgi:glycosyltransferase involved in cell wall biosynthesis